MMTSSFEHEPKGEWKCHFLGAKKDGRVTGLGNGKQELGFGHALVLSLSQNIYTIYHGIILNCTIQWHEVHVHCCDHHHHPLLELFYDPKQKLCTHSTLPPAPLSPGPGHPCSASFLVDMCI